jgi:hypothetical protein
MVVPQIEEGTDSHKDIMRNSAKVLRRLPEMLPAVEGMMG